MNNRIKKIAILCLTLIASGIFARTLVTSAFYAPEAEMPGLRGSTAARDTRATTSRASPSRLSVPSLGIDAKIEKVGVNWRGNMASPADYSDVGWYEYGTVPGDPGTAVIAGHLNDGLGLSGAFEHLDEIKVGDDIVVTDEKGNRARFVVERVEAYPYDDVPTGDLFGTGTSTSSVPRLNLISCTGHWKWAEGGTYDERLVVYSVGAR